MGLPERFGDFQVINEQLLHEDDCSAHSRFLPLMSVDDRGWGYFSSLLGLFYQHLAQPCASLFKVRDLPLYGSEPSALHFTRFRTRCSAFDHAHAIGKSADLRQAEACGDQPLDLTDLGDGDGEKHPIAVFRAYGS